jgi:hypothetical protein
MAVCDTCGNDYPFTFTVITSDSGTHTFDSFECAIERVAPHCGHCGCRIVGHGIQAGGTMFCCAHCARESGVAGVSDNTEAALA